MTRLSADTIQQKLSRLEGWSLTGEAISKKYTCPSFSKAMAFVNQVADLAEQADHHPEILISYRKVTLTLSTHSEGGLTQKDFDLAEKIEKDWQVR